MFQVSHSICKVVELLWPTPSPLNAKCIWPLCSKWANYHVMMQGGQLNPLTAHPSDNWATAFPFPLLPPAGGWRWSLSAPPPKLPVQIENVAEGRRDQWSSSALIKVNHWAPASSPGRRISTCGATVACTSPRSPEVSRAIAGPGPAAEAWSETSLL